MHKNQKSINRFSTVLPRQGRRQLWERLPMMSNQRGVPGGSTAITPIMWATGSLSMTVKVKNDSSKEIGSGDGLGLEIHSIWRRVVDHFWGRPLSTALIYMSRGDQNGKLLEVTSHHWSTDWVGLRLSQFQTFNICLCIFHVFNAISESILFTPHSIITGVTTAKRKTNPYFPLSYWGHLRNKVIRERDQRLD